MTNVNQFIIWKHVPGYINVQVNQYGQVRCAATHELRNFTVNNTYYAVNCKRVGETKNSYAYVHALVMAAFKGERPEGYHIDHKDGDRLNNLVSNLRYVTRSGNMRNRKDQIIVTYNGEATILIEALEDMFGKACVTAVNGAEGFKLYARIKTMLHRGKTFDEAIQTEIKKRGWPTAPAIAA